MKNLIHNILTFPIQIIGRIVDYLFHKGCDFSKWVEMDDIGFCDEKGHKYQPFFLPIDRIIRNVCNISPNDSIIDIGCGKGYAMYRMSKLAFGYIGGYDLNPELVETANKNFALLGLDNCHAICADAEYYNDYDMYNYFFMFNSVPSTVFSYTLKNIEDSIKRTPRNVMLILANPEQDVIMKDSKVFSLIHQKKGIISWFDVYFYKYSLSTK